MKKAQSAKFKTKVVSDTAACTKQSRSGSDYTVDIFEQLAASKPELRKRAEVLSVRVLTANGT